MTRAQAARLEQAVRLLAEVVIEAAAETLAERGTGAWEGVYTSVALPPDCPTRERFNRLVKRLPGAAKQGRTWSVPRAAWDSFRRGTGSQAMSPRDLAQRSLDALGYRAR